ncbi:Proline--tRNA ligase [Buchnera aphidicola (Chaitophorus sp. 3695)]|uniref:proline--tRNA ligase n=1 Tax=Buchnera aphidicola TaxID=9 RepID=UPI003463C694
MRKTKYFLSTKKEKPNNTYSISHQLMIRSGMITQNSSGIYTWLPNGVKVLKKIIKIINQEMKKNNAIEINMPILQSSKLWEKSKRIKMYGKELFKIIDRNQNNLILSPTHEEIITQLVKNKINSYKSLPMILYQINTKFRDEIRPKSGVLRAREFIMKDAYSFHINKKSLENTYENIYQSYIKIFKKMNLKIKILQAENGIIGGNISHEFYINIKNSKKIKKNILKKKNTQIEIGHIFQLNQIYSKIFNAFIYTNQKKKKFLEMGCYGIGISRLIGAIIEKNYDQNGIIWPISIAPFQVSIIPINFLKDFLVKKITEKIYFKLKKYMTVFLYDTNEQPGIMFSEADLIGFPYRIIISHNTIKQKCIELQNRRTYSKKNIKIKNILKILLDKLKIKKKKYF